LEKDKMCDQCNLQNRDRRRLLRFAVVSIGTLGLGAVAKRVYAASGPTTSKTAGDALAALKSGNASFIDQPKLCLDDLASHRNELVEHQSPWATVIACADSRVPPELIFGDRGLGELFVARNAGNLVDTATLGTVEYGAAVLGAPLVVVLAHTHCGAVTAACDVVNKNATYPGAIGRMIEPIIPAALAVKNEPGDFVNNTAKESARRTAARLATPGTLLGNLVGSQKLKIVPAIYDLESGVVSFL
jgi:carbonic anhydrase